MDDEYAGADQDDVPEAEALAVRLVVHTLGGEIRRRWTRRPIETVELPEHDDQEDQ